MFEETFCHRANVNIIIPFTELALTLARNEDKVDIINFFLINFIASIKMSKPKINSAKE